jgi:hypothetical protein
MTSSVEPMTPEHQVIMKLSQRLARLKRELRAVEHSAAWSRREADRRTALGREARKLEQLIVWCLAPQRNGCPAPAGRGPGSR